jgi:hypothetical protein
MYRSQFSWSRHYLEVSGLFHAPVALSPGIEPTVPIGCEVGLAPEPVWKTWKKENSWPYRDPNSDHSFVQPVASRYTDWSIPAPGCVILGAESIIDRLKQNKLRGLSPWANYTDRATAACRRSSANFCG